MVDDRFGRLSLSKAGLAQRDEMVLRFCEAAAVPVAVSMGGGYAPNVNDIVDIHFQTVEITVAFSKRKANTSLKTR